MTAKLHYYGEEIDLGLKGKEVEGRFGDFSQPFISANQKSLSSLGYISFITNSASKSKTPVTVTNPKFHYRWRYLNQHFTDWKELDYAVSDVTQLITVAGFNLPGRCGDLEYYSTAGINGTYYKPIDYALDSLKNINFGVDWSEAITAITNRASYTVDDGLPSGGTDYFVRIREGESDYEWIKWNAELTTPGATNDVSARMELVGDHTWRYHYYVREKDIGGKLTFHFSGKKVYTNDTPFVFSSHTNTWYSSETEIYEIPLTSTLGGAADASITLDGTGTHLLFELNDEKESFSVSHATYQDVNMWTDAREGYRGNSMATNDDSSVVSDSGVSDKKEKFEPEFVNWKTCPYESVFWQESFDTSDTATYPMNQLFSNHPTPNGWSAVAAQFVSGARNDNENLAAQLSGGGAGALTMENFNVSTVPPGVDTVSFTARIAQQLKFNDFVYNMYATGLKNYGFSARLTMSRRYMDANYNPPDLSPVYPSISLVGYYRPGQGCYEFRMTRTDDGGTKGITFALYKWTSDDSSTTATLLQKKFVNQSTLTHLLVPVNGDATNATDTAAFNGAYGYITLRTTGDNSVAIRCAVTKTRYPYSTAINASGVEGNFIDLFGEVIDSNPGKLRLGGSYGIGAVDCQAAFGSLMRHDLLATGAIDYAGTSEYENLENEGWVYYESRWGRLTGAEVNNSNKAIGSGLRTWIPQNQTMKVYLADAATSNGKDANWVYSGYEVAVPSFSTNRFEVSPQMPGLWKVRLQTGGEASDDVITDVVVDDVMVTPWQGVSVGETYGENRADNYEVDEWAYTKAWIGSSAEITCEDKPFGGYDLESAGTNGYVFIFNQAAGMIQFVPKMDLVVDRILIVGGGGAGGWTLGGGGGGGGVLEYDFGTNAVTIAQGEKVFINVGPGGDNYYVKNNDGGNWKSGANGGTTSISSPSINLQANRNVNTALSVKGGGGGGKWGSSGNSSATGGGAAQGTANNAYRDSVGGTAGQGSGGGRAYGDRAGGGGGAALDASGKGQDGSPDKDGAGDGGAGRASDITGVIEYYGGGGGGGGGDGDKTPNSTYGGKGGIGGGGTGLDAKAQSRPETLNGKDGYGGGGGGGSHGGAAGTSAGGKGGCGVVIIRCRTASKAVTLQPARAFRDTSGDKDPVTQKYLIPPQGIRSPYIENGLSMFSFSYANADTNCVLLVQIATNMVNSSPVYNLTYSSSTNDGWTTVKRFDFEHDPELATAKARESGTLTAFLSLRKHWIGDEYQSVKGLMRVIVDPAVVEKAVESTEAKLADPTSERLRTNYGQITITKVYCYDEPPIDARSWFGWNVHTEGWDSMAAGDYAYLTDWPDGLSLSLNYSSKDADNGGEKGTGDAKGIPLGDREKLNEYEANNSFVQCPEMTNGIGSVSFRARLFDTNATAAVISLYCGTDAGDNQTDEMASQGWGNPITNFVVTSPTYQTFQWKTSEDKNNYRAMRLEVAASRHGRTPGNGNMWKGWENPSLTGDLPASMANWGKDSANKLQRVFIDEISVGEPVAPRLALRQCRPFRTNLGSEDICVITNIMSADQQPILGESWGIQVQVAPQQMSEELDEDSIEVHLAVYRGHVPWGYEQWKDNTGKNMIVKECILPRVSPTNLVFRSHYTVPESIIPPEESPATYYQYMVWATYRDKSQGPGDEPHKHYLDARDWVIPDWYNGAEDYNAKYVGVDGRFSGFTILDSMSPRRAWINEVQMYEAVGDDHGQDRQFIECVVPQNANLLGWRLEATSYQLKRADIAKFGYGDASITEKMGTRAGVDYTNHFTFVSLRCPKAKTAGLVPEADGAWNPLTDYMTSDGYRDTVANHLKMDGGSFKYTNPYGIRLIRPSGIIEHEVVIQGTNVNARWSTAGADYWGTNLVTKLLASDGARSRWIFGGEDLEQGTVGVVKNHGEYGYFPNDPSMNEWTNSLTATPGALNEGQEFPINYFLPPNGTNVWIYAYANGDHVYQIVGGMTNKTAVIIVPIGTVTGITYQVDNWYETANCTTNGVACEAGNGLWGANSTLTLGPVNETLTVTVEDGPQKRLKEEMDISANSPYYDAVMNWLTTRWPNASSDDISLAQYAALSGETNRVLTLTEMYWMDIQPVPDEGDAEGKTKGENWVFLAGMGKAFYQSVGEPSDSAPVKVVEEPMLEGGGTYKNLDVTVTMMISNRATKATRRLKALQGLHPGSVSTNHVAGRWEGPTFKITGALQANGVQEMFRPVREFLLGPRSFGETNYHYTTTVQIRDPQKWESSPGWFYGWNQFPSAQIFYSWGLDDKSYGHMTIEMLDEKTRVEGTVDEDALDATDY